MKWQTVRRQKTESMILNICVQNINQNCMQICIARDDLLSVETFQTHADTRENQ